MAVYYVIAGMSAMSVSCDPLKFLRKLDIMRCGAVLTCGSTCSVQPLTLSTVPLT